MSSLVLTIQQAGNSKPYFYFEKVVLQLRFVFSLFPTHLVLFGHVHCRTEIAFLNKLRSVHKVPTAKWEKCRFRGSHESDGDILEWDIPGYLQEDFLPKSQADVRKFIPLIVERLAISLEIVPSATTRQLSIGAALPWGRGISGEFFPLLCIQTLLSLLPVQCQIHLSSTLNFYKCSLTCKYLPSYLLSKVVFLCLFLFVLFLFFFFSPVAPVTVL